MSEDRHTDEPDDGSPGPADESSAADPALEEDRTADDDRSGSGTDDDHRAADPDEPRESNSGRGLSDRAAAAVSAVFALLLAVGSVLLVEARAPFFEEILRVRPTVDGGGIGADWVVGNTMPALDIMIALVHAADVIMGIFILLMVFIHWASFRRLAARMRPPSGADRERETTAATDGGRRE